MTAPEVDRDGLRALIAAAKDAEALLRTRLAHAVPGSPAMQILDRLTQALTVALDAAPAEAAPVDGEVDSLADWLGEMDESRNVFDYTDEATTVINIDVETLAQRLAPLIAAREAQALRAFADLADDWEAADELRDLLARADQIAPTTERDGP